MDPISTIVAAVVAGASSGAQDVASKGIADAYQALKEQLRRRFGHKSEVARAMDEVERSPESGEKALQVALADASVEPDDELVTRARQLLGRTDIKNIDEVGDFAEVTDSPLAMHLDAAPDGSVRQERRVGQKAKAKGSGLSISIGGAPYPPEKT
jgi:tellurite resistance protein